MPTLIVVDVQNDFCPGGALAAPEGDQVVPVINRLMPHAAHVVATQDWHPADHKSFAANHEGSNVGDQIELAGLPQILWPVHCVQDSLGAAFHGSLDTAGIHQIIRKGTDPEIDSYSGFFDNGHKKATGLHEHLQRQGAEDLWVTGLATDYCVKFTVLDALELGYNVTVVRDAVRGVNLQPGDDQHALEDMEKAGAAIAESKELHA
jgi:nicotinamidase/pyrazinamidase